MLSVGQYELSEGQEIKKICCQPDNSVRLDLYVASGSRSLARVVRWTGKHKIMLSGGQDQEGIEALYRLMLVAGAHCLMDRKMVD